jgi:predicted dehydrogenase
MSSKGQKFSRREFLSESSKVAAGIAAAGALSSCAQETVLPLGRVIGANDRINLAIIGIRGRGMGLAEDFVKIPNVQIKTVCDVDENIAEDRANKLGEKQDRTPMIEYDMRRVFDDPDIDAVVIATPNHWHALASIWACQAGKHVYVEKPCSYSLWEGRKMVEAAARYRRIVEVGFQNRSIKNVRQAMAFLHGGGIGDVYMAKGLCYKARDSIGTCKDGLGTGKDFEHYVWGSRGVNFDEQYMSRVHYDLWLGPARVQPFNYNRFHYNWHWNWEYGNGDIGNQGPHQFDVARWGLNKNEHPVKVSSSGGFYGPKCDQQTPNTQTATLEYADGKILQFEVRGLLTNAEGASFTKGDDGKYSKVHDGTKIGNLFFGTKGWLYINGSTWQSYLGRGDEKGPGSSSKDEFADPMNLAGAGGAGHVGNFIYALRTGRNEDLTCHVSEGHMSTALPHLANISYRLGRSLRFDGRREKFVGDSQANRMLKRASYRSPYVVPERV